MKITNIETLRSEKTRLQNEAATISASLMNDAEMIKRAIRPWALIHSAVTALIPEVLKKSKITAMPINFLLKTIFGDSTGIKPNDPAAEKRQRIKEVAVGVLETAAMFFLTRGAKKRS